MIDDREQWIQGTVRTLRWHMERLPCDIFTAEGFVLRLPEAVHPKDKRWTGLAFKRAAKEGIIAPLKIRFRGSPRGEFTTILAPTVAGHHTVVWTRP